MANKPLTVARIVRVLKKVPEKRFRIMDLAPELVDENGNVDVVKAMDRQGDLNLAIVEVESYIRATRDAAKALRCIGSRPAGHEVDDDYEEEGVEVGEE